MSTAPTTNPPERVLSTLNRDGTRRWLHPRLSKGRFLKWRRVVAYALILFFVGLPWVRINGRQSILIDLPAREFTFFGTTFLPTDTLLLMLFMAGVFVTIFLVTALFGRLWCGWACPQTVYMEFVYRPLERLFDGSPEKRRRGHPGSRGVRKVLKYVVYFIISLVLAHVFLSYFVGVDTLFDWMGQSPFRHPTAFLVMAATTGLMMFDFSFFREQVCIVACPYGRFQSVMLDRSSMIISYDEQRGEPRGKARRKRSGDVELPQHGDCVDCHLCVVTCPTGIDIREGLQMECIGCAQCIDACDHVMDKLGRARGLIRYTSQEALEQGRKHLLRPRVVIYPLLLGIIVSIFVTVLVTRQPADITVLRGADARPYTKREDGRVVNDIRVKIVNRTEGLRAFSFAVSGIDGAIVEAEMPVPVEGGDTLTAPASIVVPQGAFDMGRAIIYVEVTDDVDFEQRIKYRIQGPLGGGSGSSPPAEEAAP